MKKICKNCKFFYYEPILQVMGKCRNTAFVYDDGSIAKLPLDGLTYWDGEGELAGFEVGLEFGCIHFEKKVENEKAN